MTDRMQAVVGGFALNEIDAYCNLFDETAVGYTKPRQFMDGAIKVLRTRDVVFAIQASDRRSEGQLMELGIAHDREIPIILARHVSVGEGSSYLHEFAEATFAWETTDDLLRIVNELTLSKVFA